ncbi:hypothetical protein IG631_07901 [Alternaria alternata]|nr:hypothetical protein IG631_07901 [Alternaria alternata]
MPLLTAIRASNHRKLAGREYQPHRSRTNDDAAAVRSIVSDQLQRRCPGRIGGLSRRLPLASPRRSGDNM